MSRGQPWFSGQQHHAGVTVAEHLTQRLDQAQASIFGFHYDIEQHQGDILLLSQYCQRFAAAECLHQLNTTTEHLEFTQGKGRRALEIGIIINRQHTPHTLAYRARKFVVAERKLLIHERCPHT